MAVQTEEAGSLRKEVSFQPGHMALPQQRGGPSGTVSLGCKAPAACAKHKNDTAAASLPLANLGNGSVQLLSTLAVKIKDRVRRSPWNCLAVPGPLSLSGKLPWSDRGCLTCREGMGREGGMRNEFLSFNQFTITWMSLY